MKKYINKIIDHRYIVFLVLFIFCILLKIHGSSIGMYDNIIQNKLYPAHKTEILGVSRAIRSDEWMVHTPYYFSQQYNNYNKYSKKMSYDGQNMIIGYNAPVYDITTISKPFTWGYLLLGNEYGLSWYWCSKLLLLILISFELIMILTNNNKKMAILGTLLISFAPPMQWWFVPHITDVFFWTMAVITLTYNFFTAENTKRKIIFTILTPISYIGYCLALFPSCQVPLAYISLALIIGLLIRDKEKITITKKEWPRILFVIFLTITVLGQFIYTSINDIKLLLNTVYPGSRISTGNDMGFKELFTDLTTPFLPYKTITYLNNCEASTFIHLSPIFLITYFTIKEKIKDKKDFIIGKILLITLIVELSYSLIGFPEILAKITLFKYINRMNLIYGFTSTIFSIWSIYIIYHYKIKFDKKYKITTTILFAMSYIITITKEQLEYLPIYIYALEIIYISIIVYQILGRKKLLPFTMITALIIFSSATINPISRGINAFKNHKTTKVISKIAKKDNGHWLVTDSPAYAGYVLACGANVANATNFYPDYGKWKLIDKEKKYEDFYNRYANMTVKLTREETNFEMITPDHLKINLNYQDISKLKIKYIFTLDNLEENLEVENIKYRKMYEDQQIKIYKIGVVSNK